MSATERAVRPVYSTWIRRRRIILFGLLTGVSAVGVALALVHVAFALFVLPALLFGYIATIITMSAYRFSARGGRYQERIHHLIADAIPAEGSVLDVGCGSGALLVGVARRNPERRCVGVDTWGNDWEYSAQQCERNAAAEGVANVTFHRGSAAALPFPDSSFANVISCLTFHEVRDVADKTAAVSEAIRVLEPGGRFAFLDLFHDPAHFGAAARVHQAIEAAGGQVDASRRLSELLPLPFPLNTKRVLLHAALVRGRKL